MYRIVTLLLSGLLWAGTALADEAPISGTIKAVDPVAQTVTLETTAKGKTRAGRGGGATAKNHPL